MSDKPVFIYAAAYETVADADADFDAVLSLHAAGAIGTFDAAVIEKADDGKVHVHKVEKPTQHAAWTGIGVGAVVGFLFPPSLIGTVLAGGVVGGVAGHLWKGMSRGDLKDLGEALDAGQGAIVVIGESKLEQALEKAITRAVKTVEKELKADAKALRKEIEQAEREAG
ncbi:MAG: DUF1269 domain-containing protein [Solirubrobacterales bacterium]